MSEPVDFCKKRFSHLKQQMEEHELDLVYLLNGGGGARFKRIANTPTGVALIVPIDGQPKLFCYSVNYISTHEESWIPVEQLESRAKANMQIAEYANKHLKKGSKVGAPTGDFNHASLTYFNENFSGELADISGDVIPEVFYGLYPEEIKFQRKVCRLADIACSAAREAMRTGITEYELAAEAEYAMRTEGAEFTSFDTIISTGPRSAYSHGWPTSRKLKKGDFMLVDLGPAADGYAGDETRTFLLGKNPKKEKMLATMDKAVQAVIDNIKPGARCKELDAISRRVLKEHGYPDYPHSLGHPLSGFVTPILSKTSEHVLKEGMIFTVEPGIYLPGYGGVRMEENVVITSDGFEQLTKSPRL
ncbi:MAG: Xaa-Pro peptidase family protein [Candidatus Bathyarchaeota archaeon]|nr:Xaa-Pro peptidase family protein [Candidatus Bathyarchaeota archaeon]